MTSKQKLALIRKQEAEIAEMLEKLEASLIRDGIPLPPDPRLAWRKVVGFSLSEESNLRLDEILGQVQQHVTGRVSRSSIVDYLIRTSPEISAEDYVRLMSPKFHGKGIPNPRLRSLLDVAQEAERVKRAERARVERAIADRAAEAAEVRK